MSGKLTEKERKQIEIKKRKFQLEQERITKPPECYKFLTAFVDKSLASEIAGSKIVTSLKQLEIKVEVSSQLAANTIVWKRAVPKKIISDDGKVTDFGSVQKEEPYLMVILQAEKFVKLAKENQHLSKIQEAVSDLNFQPTSTTLVIYGLKDFCRRNKNVIGMKEMEIKLTQIQLFANCSHRLHESPDDVALTVTQMSKAIAEEPFKAKQNQKLDQEQLYLTNDTKVSADEDSGSLARLWHTQLITLPKVTYEVAQSIIKVYPLPMILIEAYKESPNPSKLLADLPIIRTGPLAKTRKIGPELSRKIHTLLTSKNPDDIL